MSSSLRMFLIISAAVPLGWPRIRLIQPTWLALVLQERSISLRPPSSIFWMMLWYAILLFLPDHKNEVAIFFVSMSAFGGVQDDALTYWICELTKELYTATLPFKDRVLLLHVAQTALIFSRRGKKFHWKCCSSDRTLANHMPRTFALSWSGRFSGIGGTEGLPPM